MTLRHLKWHYICGKFCVIIVMKTECTEMDKR